ncbi:MAG: hypothetical protein L0312_14025 [Acidobacteria bacterium]|nr:hypothetical protein [Acidobacteriota bacterium]
MRKARALTLMMILVVGVDQVLVARIWGQEVGPASGTQPSTSTSQAPGLDPAAQRIKQKVEAIGIAKRITVILKNGEERYATVAAIGPDTFRIIEVDLKQELTFGYEEVKQVRKDYGRKNAITGKRVNPLWGRVVGLVLVGTFVIVIGVAGVGS